MEHAGIYRTTRLTLIGAGLALALGGCAAAGNLFGDHAGDVASNGGTIADAVVAPAADQSFFSERLVHLPHSYFPTDPDRAIAATPSRAELGLPESGVVFCCTNNSWKITRPVFSIWMRLLGQVPGSVLLLKAAPPDIRVNLEKEAARHDIAAERLVWADDLPLAQHLARYRVADLL